MQMMLGKVFVVFCLALASTQESFAYVRRFARSIDDHHHHYASLSNITRHQSVVILGASGDLAKREIYPALWYLYREKLLPSRTRIVGFARKKLTIDDLRNNIAPFIEVSPEDQKLYDEFWKLNVYISSVKDDVKDYDNINELLEKLEEHQEADRIFYLSLPPSIFLKTAAQIKRACMAKNGATRLVIEKPFGRDYASSETLSNQLSQLFTEDQLYRMDHFLGYEVIQNLVALRFANRLLTPTWNKENIASIEVLFQENFGIEGRGGYFDEYGIIRDVMQNHLLQIVSLVAMEMPNNNQADDIRDAKIEVLKKTKPISIDDVVLGQYISNPDSNDPRERIGYRQDPTVPDNSNQSTFALTVLKIENERWSGVPFIIRAGKGLNVNQTDIIIQYKSVSNSLFDNKKRNKLVIRIGRVIRGLEAKIASKVPGITSDLDEISIDFNYNDKYKDVKIPGAYARLFLDVFDGVQKNFVRTDELREAWRIFTPMLHEIENKNIKPILYKFGSTGPAEADEMEKKNNFL